MALTAKALRVHEVAEVRDGYGTVRYRVTVLRVTRGKVVLGFEELPDMVKVKAFECDTLQPYS